MPVSKKRKKKGPRRHKKNRLFFCPDCKKYRCRTSSDMNIADMVADAKAGRRRAVIQTCNGCRGEA